VSHEKMHLFCNCQNYYLKKILCNSESYLVGPDLFHTLQQLNNGKTKKLSYMDQLANVWNFDCSHNIWLIVSIFSVHPGLNSAFMLVDPESVKILTTWLSFLLPIQWSGNSKPWVSRKAGMGSSCLSHHLHQCFSTGVSRHTSVSWDPYKCDAKFFWVLLLIFFCGKWGDFWCN